MQRGNKMTVVEKMTKRVRKRIKA